MNELQHTHLFLLGVMALSGLVSTILTVVLMRIKLNQPVQYTDSQVRLTLIDVSMKAVTEIVPVHAPDNLRNVVKNTLLLGMVHALEVVKNVEYSPTTIDQLSKEVSLLINEE